MSLLSFPLLSAALLALPVLFLLRRPLALLLRLGLRSAAGLVLLALIARLSPLLGPVPGVNPANALVLGVLGIPGLGLLFLLRALLR